MRYKTLKEIIAIADELNPNAYSNNIKAQWVNEVETAIQTEVFVIAPVDVVSFLPYEDNKDKELSLDETWDKIYLTYLQAMIDFSNKEYAAFNNDIALYNSYVDTYAKWYVRHHGDGEPLISGMYLSAYGIAVKYGFTGTEEEWITSLKGEKGDTGHGLEIKGRVVTYEELPDNAEPGDIWQVGLSGLLYLWDGKWEFLGSYKGEQGPQGSPGEKGDKGDKGDKGVGIDYILVTDDEASRTTGIFIYDTEGNGDSGLVRWGKDGHTPQKGVDYWTEEDKAEIISEIPSGGTWETIADITIPDGFASYSYTITSATYPDMAKITDFYIVMTVPKQSDGAISGALQVQLQPKLVANYVINIARFGNWNHASYIMKGFVFSKLYGDKRHNQYYGFSANATMDLSNNSLLGGLDVGYFEAVNIALSDTSKTLPVGMTIKIVGCKK